MKAICVRIAMLTTLVLIIAATSRRFTVVETDPFTAVMSESYEAMFAFDNEDSVPIDAGMAKISADMAGHLNCQAPAQAASEEIRASDMTKQAGEAKVVPVSALVRRALGDQVQLLAARKADLERWDRNSQLRFYKWFGTVSQTARVTIYKRIRLEMVLNSRFSTGNFRRAIPSRPGVFAFVHPTDPSKVFLDMSFLTAPRIGENSKAGTITHEMSHFVVIGGTQDFTYGTESCKRLARINAARAMGNADNFEFYVENAP